MKPVPVSGKVMVGSMLGFSLFGSAIIAGPVLFNMDAVRDGGLIQEQLLDAKATWNRLARQLVGSSRPSDGDPPNTS